MSNKKTLTLGAVAVALVAVVGLSAFTFASDPAQPAADNSVTAPCPFAERFKEGKGFLSEEQRSQMQVKQEAVKVALDAGDYQAWLAAVADSPMADQVTEDEFSKLLEAHQLMQEGQAKFEQAKQLKDEIGLTMPGKGQGFGQGMHRFQKNNKPAN